MKLLLLSAVAALGCGLLQAACAADEPWRVEHRLKGEGNEKAKDVSGIACANQGLPRKCLVIDNEVPFAQIVIVKDDELIAGDTIDLVDSGHKPRKIDGEGVAFSQAHAGRPDTFYVIGSHSHPRDDEADAGKIKAHFDASSVLVRIPLGASDIDKHGKLVTKPKAIALVDLRPMIYVEPKLEPLRPFLGKPLDEKHRGLTIEGVAAVEGRLYVGLRSPTLGTAGDGAVIFSFDQDAPFEGKPANARLDVLPLGKERGVRDLSAYGSTLLVLAGPTYEASKTGKTGEYSIYAWDRSSGLRLLIDLPPFREEDKLVRPEALLPLRTRADGGLDMLVLSDGATEGGPRLVKIPK